MLAGGSWCLEPKVLKAVRQSVYDNIDEYRKLWKILRSSNTFLLSEKIT